MTVLAVALGVWVLLCILLHVNGIGMAFGGFLIIAILFAIAESITKPNSQ